MDREAGKQALATVLKKEQNVIILEKIIFDNSNEETYKEILFQAIGDIIQGKLLKTISNNIKKNKSLWNHSCFNDIRNRIKEQDDFIENPFEVEEGVLECKCGSKRVFSYTKQVRSGDESMTTFAQCIACKAKWTYSG